MQKLIDFDSCLMRIGFIGLTS